jgi:23S rRNA (cytosine1962-C5)-methyltransferase
MSFPSIRLKPGRDKSLRARHPWVFSGGLQPAEIAPGSCARILSAEGEFLALAYVNLGISLAARVISFRDCSPEQAVRENIRAAVRYRQALFRNGEVNAYRLVNAEGDQLPGLIVDAYAGHLVLQIGSLGMQNLRELVIDELQTLLTPRAILERSDSSSRAEEGLAAEERLWSGELPEALVVQEYGLKLEVNLRQGQKTGLFLDQREMRRAVGQYVQQFSCRSLLNCYCYSGGFSLQAVQAGCPQVVSVDTSKDALQQLSRNIELNQQQPGRHSLVREDVADYLTKTSEQFDAIVLDPPAFVKGRQHITQGCKGYRRINQLAFERLKPGGVLWTFSCSYHLDEKLFRQLLFQSAAEARREVQVLQSMQHALDHPVSLYHPEGAYLKGVMLRVQ